MIWEFVHFTPSNILEICGSEFHKYSYFETKGIGVDKSSILQILIRFLVESDFTVLQNEFE